ncbi:MAG: SurA N-terminal domain-containing protein [Desulfovibrionaceae bacterium]|nr:SurA N-terminal domain-containing protein [Desulfovibrionaceae bacterium]
MKKRIFLLLLMGICTAVPAQSASRAGNVRPPALATGSEEASPSTTVGKIVAVVNGERITALDVERMARPEIMRRRLNPNTPEHRAQIDEIYNQVLDAQINDVLVYQEALRLKTELQENEVDKEVTRLMQQRKLSLEELEKQLKQEGMDIKSLREQIRKGLLRQRLLSSMVARKIILNRDEVAKYYEEHKESFRAISEVRMAIIVYPPNINADAIAQRIKSGKLSFEEAVRQYSIDPATKSHNGAMPPAPWKDMSPDWRERISAMKPGELSDIFIVPHDQFLIRAQIKLLERIGDDKVRSLAEATPEIEAILREPLLKARFTEYTQWLRSRAIVDIKGL